MLCAVPPWECHLNSLGPIPLCPPWQASEQGVKGSDILGPGGDMMSEVGWVVTAVN